MVAEVVLVLAGLTGERTAEKRTKRNHNATQYDDQEEE